MINSDIKHSIENRCLYMVTSATHDKLACSLHNYKFSPRIINWILFADNFSDYDDQIITALEEKEFDYE